MSKPRYPNIHVKLIGEDGNAGATMGRVTSAMHRAKVGDAEQNEFRMQCISGDYDHLLQTVMEWVATDEEATDEAAHLYDLVKLETENKRIRAEIAALKKRK